MSQNLITVIRNTRNGRRVGVMNEIDVLKKELANTRQKLMNVLYSQEIDFDYDIWEGCYTDDEYDIRTRYHLAKIHPEFNWSNPNHEEMLLEMALDSHGRRWKPEYSEGGWSKERFMEDGLHDLLIYSNMRSFIENKD
jgi:hypothetical protein